MTRQNLKFFFYQGYEGFQLFSSLQVLHYLQVVLLIKIWTIVVNILYNTL